MFEWKRLCVLLVVAVAAASLCTGCGQEAMPVDIVPVAEVTASPSPAVIPGESLQPQIEATTTDPSLQGTTNTDVSYGVAGDNVLPSFESYEAAKAINDEVIGWITIDGMVIDYPVVRTENNEYYLNRDVEKKKSNYGAIFMDYRNADPNMQKHIILYGHNMKNGTMFHDLMNYKQSDFFSDHKTIRLIWDGVETKWEVFLAYIVMPDTIYHIHTMFADDQNFANVMNETIQYAKTVKPANYDASVTIRPSDQVLTLSTCTYEYDGSYFAVMARRVK